MILSFFPHMKYNWQPLKNSPDGFLLIFLVIIETNGTHWWINMLFAIFLQIVRIWCYLSLNNIFILFCKVYIRRGENQRKNNSLFKNRVIIGPLWIKYRVKIVCQPLPPPAPPPPLKIHGTSLDFCSLLQLSGML